MCEEFPPFLEWEENHGRVISLLFFPFLGEGRRFYGRVTLFFPRRKKIIMDDKDLRRRRRRKKAENSVAIKAITSLDVDITAI